MPAPSAWAWHPTHQLSRDRALAQVAVAPAFLPVVAGSPYSKPSPPAPIAEVGVTAAQHVAGRLVRDQRGVPYNAGNDHTKHPWSVLRTLLRQLPIMRTLAGPRRSNLESGCSATNRLLLR
jgi:hypothetical protein